MIAKSFASIHGAFRVVKTEYGTEISAYILKSWAAFIDYTVSIVTDIFMRIFSNIGLTSFAAKYYFWKKKKEVQHLIPYKQSYFWMYETYGYDVFDSYNKLGSIIIVVGIIANTRRLTKHLLHPKQFVDESTHFYTYIQFRFNDKCSKYRRMAHRIKRVLAFFQCGWNQVIARTIWLFYIEQKTLAVIQQIQIDEKSAYVLKN